MSFSMCLGLRCLNMPILPTLWNSTRRQVVRESYQREKIRNFHLIITDRMDIIHIVWKFILWHFSILILKSGMSSSLIKILMNFHFQLRKWASQVLYLIKINFITSARMNFQSFQRMNFMISFTTGRQKMHLKRRIYGLPIKKKCLQY